MAAFNPDAYLANKPFDPDAYLETKEPSLLQRLGKGVADYARRSVAEKANLAAGAVRGAGSIGATLLTPYDLLAGNTQSIGNPERRQAIEEGLRSMGADPESAAFQVGKIGTEIVGTAGAGSALAKGLGMIPGVASRAPALINALQLVQLFHWRLRLQDKAQRQLEKF